MADQEIVNPAQDADAEVSEPSLPAHLSPAWFAEGAPVPAFMADNPNWMNAATLQDQSVWVRFPDGTVQKTASPIHLGVWLLQSHAVIIAEPKEG